MTQNFQIKQDNQSKNWKIQAYRMWKDLRGQDTLDSKEESLQILTFKDQRYFRYQNLWWLGHHRYFA